MNKNWKQDMADILAAGRVPTNDELEEALAGAIASLNLAEEEIAKISEERDRLAVAVTNMTIRVAEMSLWLGKIVAAFIERDADKLAATVGGYVAKYVRFVDATSRELH